MDEIIMEVGGKKVLVKMTDFGDNLIKCAKYLPLFGIFDNVSLQQRDVFLLFV